jgi:hypothetical protein
VPSAKPAAQSEAPTDEYDPPEKKPSDLTYHPRFDTDQGPLVPRMQKGPPAAVQPIPSAPQTQKGQSLAEKITSFLPDRLDSLAKKITSFLPEGRIRDKAQDIVKGAIEKGLTAGLDGLLKNAGVNESDRKAIGKAAEAAIEQKPGGN